MERNSKIYVAGHTGLVGSAITRCLKEAGYNNLIFRTLNELDLTCQQDVEEFFLKEAPGPLEPVDEPVEEAEDLPLSEDVTGRRAADPPKSSRARTAEPEDEGPEPLQELETLPDVGALETAFSPAPREAATGAELSGDPGDKDRGKDPVLLAKVVQTLLRKEKEG